MGRTIKILISVVRAGKIIKTFLVTLGIKEEYNLYMAELAVIIYSLNYLLVIKY
jgi:hypothetical protein